MFQVHNNNYKDVCVVKIILYASDFAAKEIDKLINHHLWNKSSSELIHILRMAKYNTKYWQ